MNIPQSRVECQKPDLLTSNRENPDPKQQDRTVLHKWFTTELHTKAQIPGEYEALTRRERQSVWFQITARGVPAQLHRSYFTAGCADGTFPLSCRKAKWDSSVPAWDSSSTVCRAQTSPESCMLEDVGEKGGEILSGSGKSQMLLLAFHWPLNWDSLMSTWVKLPPSRNQIYENPQTDFNGSQDWNISLNNTDGSVHAPPEKIPQESIQNRVWVHRYKHFQSVPL